MQFGSVRSTARSRIDAAVQASYRAGLSSAAMSHSGRAVGGERLSKGESVMTSNGTNADDAACHVPDHIDMTNTAVSPGTARMIGDTSYAHVYTMRTV